MRGIHVVAALCVVMLAENLRFSACSNTAGCIGRCPSQDPLNYTVLLPHEDCKKFCMCSNGIPYLFNCPAGLHFDIVKKVCDYPSSAVCGVHSTTETPTTIRTTRTTTETSPISTTTKMTTTPMSTETDIWEPTTYIIESRINDIYEKNSESEENSENSEDNNQWDNLDKDYDDEYYNPKNIRQKYFLM